MLGLFEEHKRDNRDGAKGVRKYQWIRSEGY